MILLRGGGDAGLDDQNDVAEALDAWRATAVEIERERVKEIYGKLHSGGCRILSEAMGKVEECKCFLCQVDGGLPGERSEVTEYIEGQRSAEDERKRLRKWVAKVRDKFALDKGCEGYRADWWEGYIGAVGDIESVIDGAS